MNDTLLRLMKERQSTRSPFDPEKPISKTDLEQILEAGSWAPTAHNMQNFEILVVTDKKLLQQIGELSVKTSAAFIRENLHQLSFSVEELQQKKVGILGTMFPSEWRNPDTDFEKLVEETPPSQLKYSLKDSPAVLIVLYDPQKRAPASEHDVLGMISLGCVMENMWLMAQSLGIGFQILSVFSGEALEKELQKILSIPDSVKIAYAVRLGYPREVQTTGTNPTRVRRDIQAFTHMNSYKNK